MTKHVHAGNRCRCRKWRIPIVAIGVRCKAHGHERTDVADAIRDAVLLPNAAELVVEMECPKCGAVYETMPDSEQCDPDESLLVTSDTEGAFRDADPPE